MHSMRNLLVVLLVAAALQVRGGEVEVIPLPDERPFEKPSDGTLEENHRKLWFARRLYRSRDYATAARFCRDILVSDPQNRHALELQMQCEEVLRNQQRELKTKAEEIREEDALDMVEEASRVPGRPVIVARPEPKTRGKTPRTPEEIRMDEMLSQRISLNFINVDLDYLLNTLFKATGVNIIADQATIDGKSLTVHVENMPLKGLLDFITKVHSDLSYTVTPEAVWIVSSDKPMLEPRIYPLNTGLVAFGDMQMGGTGRRTASSSGGIVNQADVARAISQAVGGGAGGGGGGGGGAQGSYLEEVLGWVSGWPDLWPADSQYFIDKKTNSLMVITTPDMHRRLEAILDVVDRPPLQVLIRTKFIEVNSTNEKDLGFDISIPPDSEGGDPFLVDTNRRYNFNAGTGTNLGVAAGEGFNIVFTGFQTEPQFQAILRALEKNTRAKLLSAPQILALNNQKAVMDVATTFSYVSQYKSASTTTTTTSTTTQAPSILVPDQFEDIDVGFHLEVTPSVGNDLKTIALELHPLVDDVEGGTDRFQQFEVISAEVTAGTTQTVQRPIIKKREVVTRLIIEDGGVVVLGGLLRNRAEKVVKRVPFLGYLPLIGLLFRSQSDTVERSNLFIVVQANIVTPAGEHYADGDEILPRAETALRVDTGSPDGWIFDYTPDVERTINRALYPAVNH
ncbi:MAG: hypothetical protein JW909_12425 [Planctomycetes bacterium]|nr:hypothetical protein [Planctomycetota bacterium]